jgi:hypothetical protein
MNTRAMISNPMLNKNSRESVHDAPADLTRTRGTANEGKTVDWKSGGLRYAPP